jgi:hypothetical protein
MIRIAVHVQGPMMVAMPEERHAKMKRSDPQSECRSRLRSEEECCNCQRSADRPHDSAPEIIEKLTATNAHQYRQVPYMPRDSGLSFIRSSLIPLVSPDHRDGNQATETIASAKLSDPHHDIDKAEIRAPHPVLFEGMG